MKVIAILGSILLAVSVAAAQANSPQANSTQAPVASTAQPQSTPASPPAAANGAHRVLQAKSQDEMKAYQDAVNKTDAAQLEAAANDFGAKYPDSELRASLYIRAMGLYAQANNNEKVIEMGRKAVADDPRNPIPLVQVASTLSETTRDTDLDREQRLAEAAKDAQGAIDNLDTGLLIPATATPEQVTIAKNGILSLAYGTLGMVAMSRDDYAAAETNLRKAIDYAKENPEPVFYLRLSVAQDKLKQYADALDSANKAVQYAKDGTPAQNLAKQQQQRLQQLLAAQSGGTTPSGGPAAPPAPNGQTSPPPVVGSSPR